MFSADETATIYLKVNNYLNNRENPAQFENRIKPRVYVRRITHSTMYGKAGTGIRKNSSVACGYSPIKIHFYDYQKSLIGRLKLMKFMFLK